MSTHARRVSFYDAYEILVGHLITLEAGGADDMMRAISLRGAIKMMRRAFDSGDDARMEQLRSVLVDQFAG